MKPVIVGLACLLSCIITHASTLTHAQQIAKENGITLYNQYKTAEPEMRIAAEAGDREAQYYLAEDLRRTNRYMTEEAYSWYTTAAEQGNLYAMRQLSPIKSDLCIAMENCPKGLKSAEDWNEKLISTATELAEKGDGEAMYLLHHATNNLEWLEKSAAVGYAHSQFWLASKYAQGDKFFLFPWEKDAAIESLLKRSAEGGDPKGITRYYGLLQEKGELEGARYWLRKGAETGHTVAFSNYALFLSDPNNPLRLPVDLVESYGLMSLLLELDGGGDMLPLAKDELPRIAAQMTPEQIEQAEAFAKEWKATHPPLSYFPGKLGF